MDVSARLSDVNSKGSSTMRGGIFMGSSVPLASDVGAFYKKQVVSQVVQKLW